MANPILFDKVKSMFETVAEYVTCNFCHEVIWDSPIFESTGGITACEKCTLLTVENGFQRNFKTEKVLLAFGIHCKYESDGCEVSKGPHNVILHEENCEFRMVSCPHDYSTCKKKKFQFRKLLKHLKSTHGIVFKPINDGSGLNGSFSLNVFLSDFANLTSHFVANSAFSIENNDFIVQRYIDEAKESSLLWVRCIGSKFEAKDFTYKIEINGPGQFLYKGPVRHIDEKSDDIIKSKIGLNIPNTILEACLQENRLNISVEIEHSNSNGNQRRNPVIFESEKYNLEEPLSKKIKTDNTE